MLTNFTRPTRSLPVRTNGAALNQRREFRFGIWASYLDPEFHREMRRRTRSLKYKHLDGLSRILAWDKHPKADEATRVVRRMACHSRRLKDLGASRSAPGFQGGVRTPMDNPTGVRPGMNIEDVERGALEDLLFGHGVSTSSRSSGSAARAAKATVCASGDPSAPSANEPEVQAATAPPPPTEAAQHFSSAARATGLAGSIESDYVFDPISNKKVPKVTAKTSLGEALEPSSTDSLAKDYKRHFAQFDPPEAPEPLEPYYSDGPPPAAELSVYRKVNIDANPSEQIANHFDRLFQVTDLPAAPENLRVFGQVKTAREPILESEDYVKNINTPNSHVRLSPESNRTKYAYKGVIWHRDDGLSVNDANDFSKLLGLRTDATTGVDRSAPEYDDLDKYKPIMGKGLDADEDSSAEYKDLDKYKPVMGKETSVAEDPAPEYEDLDKYKPVMGKEQTTAEDPTAKYDDLDKYQPVAGKEAPAPEDPTAQYKDLDQYQPVRHNEPNGKPVEQEEAYPDLPKYKAFMYNEPDGKPPGHQEHIKDVDQYQPILHSEVHVVAQHEVYADLPKYKAFMYNEPDGKPPGHQEQPAPYDPAELSKYEAFRWNEPDGKPLLGQETGYEVDELLKYQAVRHNEPDGKPSVSDGSESEPSDLQEYLAVRYLEPDGKPSLGQETGYEVDELLKYQSAVRHNEPDGKPALGQETGYEVDELQKYQSAVRHNEPDGKAPPQKTDSVQESLEEFDAENRSSSKNSYVEPTAEEKAEDLDLLRASDVRSSAGVGQSSAQAAPEQRNREALDFSLSEHVKASDAVDQEASVALKQAKKNAAAVDSAASSKNYAAQRTSSRLLSALDRSLHQSPIRSRLAELERQKAMYDPYSTTPQGLETSYAEECNGRPTWPTYVKTYGSLESAAAYRSSISGGSTVKSRSGLSSNSPSETAAPKQTVYKILAYDPTMQTINVAETSSSVPDSATALPPGEALLRLSNPTKFFPHFAPLQAQGFEIISGSGDVLVFRKVRDPITTTTNTNTVNPRQQQQAAGVPSSSSSFPSTITETAAIESTAPPAVNPIDMTGAVPPVPRRLWPASARFASPTGYVNYDGPEPVDVTRLPPPPPLPPRRLQTSSVSSSSVPVSPGFRSNIDVRRVEDVYSGGNANTNERTRSDRNDKKPGIAKRVLVGATWVAGVSYALGVVGEYFTTGGVEGKGPNKRF